jgi:hypothetical protein
LDLRQSKPAPVPPSAPITSVVASSSSTSMREDGEVSPEPPTASEVSMGKAKQTERDLVKEDWVKRTSMGGNMSLMTVKKRCVSSRSHRTVELTSSNVLASQPRPPRRPKVPAQIQVLNSSTGPSGSNRVVIDGVIFQFEEGGAKLTRIGGKLLLMQAFSQS